LNGHKWRNIQRVRQQLSYELDWREALLASREAALYGERNDPPSPQEICELRSAASREKELEVFVAQLRDVNEHLLTSKLEMSHLAHHDFLTNLPNRVQLNDRLAQAISLASRNERRLAVLFLDLDRFKAINDTLGHAVGDRLLQSVAQRLIACVRNSDTVSRQGGDEFVILLAEVEHQQDAARIAEKILRALAAPHQVGEHALYITTSIGISVYPLDGLLAEELIKHADTAMYHAKEKGRNRYQFFKSEMNRRAVERQFIESSLRQALTTGSFRLMYQPKVDLRSGRIAGIEALVRWPHPERGMMYPAQFIPLAEECGLIVTLGEWVLRAACRQARTWLDHGWKFERMAVNLSPAEFNHGDLLARICAALGDSGLPPEHLELELTEGVLMDDVNGAIALLERLRSLGVHLAVDDFGTGFSSLSYLKRLPIDVLKIDQSFIRDVVENASDSVIVSSVIRIGNSLGQQVIAEGVETEEQYRFLKLWHCEQAQGNYFSAPLEAAAMERLLQDGLPNLPADA
jgi:diguanylate cyclase (GGDEF)-like protein